MIFDSKSLHKYKNHLIIKGEQMQNDREDSEIQTVQKKQTQPMSFLDQVSKSKMRFTTEGLPQIICKKIEGLVKVLNENVVDIQAIKKYLEAGIPDQAALIRQYSWKLILSYLPEDKSKWGTTISNQNKVYQGLVSMFLPEEKFPQYPLILKKGHSRFNQLQSDYLLWQQIEKDTSRTHAEFSFFATPSTEIMLPYLTNARREKFRLIHGQDEQAYKAFINNKELQRKTYRYDYMTRILYIYSKLNPKIQYVQGMNEILAPIFYLVNVTKPANAVEEASCFFMFNNAICDMIELHIKAFDKSKNGIYGKLYQINQMLMVIQPSIWRRMDELKIDPFYYCFRWITLLYAQDFALSDTLRLWESIFSAQNKMHYVKFLAIGIMISCKDVIENSDFTAILEHLQNIKENINVNEVIKITNELIDQFNTSDFGLLAEKEKLIIDKQKQKQTQKKLKQKEKEEKNKLKQEEKIRKKQQRLRQKEEIQSQTKQKQPSNQEKQKPKQQIDINRKTKSKKPKKSQKQGKQHALIKPQTEKKQQAPIAQKEKEQKTQQSKGQIQKKISGMFKRFGNMVDKLIN